MSAEILHTFTVCGRPVALDSSGAVRAVEIGYFPISSTGYRSLLNGWQFNGAPPITEEIIKGIQAALEKQAKEREKGIASAKKAGLSAVRKKCKDPVSACIELSMAFDRVVGEALFADEDDQGELLHLGLRLADTLASMPCPDRLDHHRWTVEHVQEHIDKASRQIELVRQALSDGHMLVIAESQDCSIAGFSSYASLFREAKQKTEDSIPFSDDCNATDPHTVTDNRRLRKAYLVGRDKSFIWRGHYSHDPQCSAWGFTEHIEDAYRFESLQSCIDYWRSRHNFPEDYEHCIWDGYLTFFEETKKGIRRVMPVPEQEELF